MDSPLLRRLLASALVVLAVVLALLLFWPRGEAPAPARAAVERPKARPVALAAEDGPEPTAHEARAQVVSIEDLPPDASANCKQVVTWHRRNVPGWVIEDNMSAQAMRFDETEMACLENAGVSDQILDWAQWNQKVPQGPERNDTILPRDE